MASNLPTFESTAQVEPGPVVSGAPGLEAEAKVGESISNAAQQFGTKKLEQLDIEKGAEIGGLNPNFSPEAGIGPEVQAFNNAALAANKQLISTNIATHSNSLLMAAAQNPDAQQGLAEYTQSMQSYAKSMMGNVPAANRESTKQVLMYHTSNGQLNLQKRLIQQNKAISLINYENTAQSRHDSLISAIDDSNGDITNPDGTVTPQGEAPTQIYNSMRTANEMALRARSISPKEYIAANKQLTDTFQQEMHLQQYRSALAQGTGQKYLQDMFASNQLSNVQKQKYFNGMMAIHAQQEQALGVNKSNSQQNYRKMVVGMWNGDKYNERVLSNYTLAHPGLEQQARQEVQDTQLGVSVLQAASHLPPDQQIKYINSRIPLLKTDSSAQFNRKNNLRSTILTHLSNFNNNFPKDPILYLSQHPVYQASVQQMQMQSDTNTQESAALNPDSPVRSTPVNPTQTAVNLQLARGTPSQNVIPMMNSTAKATVQTIMNTPPMQRYEFMQKLAAMPQYQGFVPQVNRELIKHGLPRSMMWAAQVEPNDPMFNTVNEAISTPQKDIESNLGKDNVTEIKAEVDSQFSNLVRSDPTLGDFKPPSFLNKIGIQFGAAPGKAFVSSNNIQNYVDAQSEYHSTDAISKFAALKAYGTHVAEYDMLKNQKSASNAVTDGFSSVANQFDYMQIGGSVISIPKGANQDSIMSYAKNYQVNNLAAFQFAIPQHQAQIYGVKQLNSHSNEVKSWVENFMTGGGLSTDTLQGGLIKAINNKELALTPRRQYYNQFIKNGHWATSPDNTGLFWIQSNGFPAQTAKGKYFEFKFGEALNNYPLDYGSASYYAKQGIKVADKALLKGSEESLKFANPALLDQNK